MMEVKSWKIFLLENGIELNYTPVYSPDLNPIEMCFNKIKASLYQDSLEFVHFNPKLAGANAVETLTMNDMRWI